MNLIVLAHKFITSVLYEKKDRGLCNCGFIAALTRLAMQMIVKVVAQKLSRASLCEIV
jgi:hypothetical protein